MVLHERHQPVEDLVLYMVHSEFTKGDSSMPIDYLVTAKSKATQPPTLRGHEKTPGSIFVVRSLLSILNNMVCVYFFC